MPIRRLGDWSWSSFEWGKCASVGGKEELISGTGSVVSRFVYGGGFPTRSRRSCIDRVRLIQHFRRRTWRRSWLWCGCWSNGFALGGHVGSHPLDPATRSVYEVDGEVVAARCYPRRRYRVRSLGDGFDSGDRRLAELLVKGFSSTTSGSRQAHARRRILRGTTRSHPRQQRDAQARKDQDAAFCILERTGRTPVEQSGPRKPQQHTPGQCRSSQSRLSKRRSATKTAAHQGLPTKARNQAARTIRENKI